MAATFTELLPDRVGEKHRAYVWAPVCDASNEFAPVAGRLTVASARCHQTYRVEESPADGFGRAFSLFKEDRSGFYSVFVSADVNEPDVCECPGFQSHRRCKHLEVLRDLIKQSQI